jgi:hypothetical protein
LIFPDALLVKRLPPGRVVEIGVEAGVESVIQGDLSAL